MIPPALRHRLRRGLLLLAGLYILMCAACASFQRRLLYYPTILTREQVDQLAGEAGMERWTNSTGQCIGLKRPSPLQPAKGSVLVMYGNGSTAVGSAHYAVEIQAVSGLDVYILEYPGYADRPGSPGQKSLFQAADQAFQALPRDRPIYLVGESLGSGVASYLAGTYPETIAGVVLISPFTSVTDVAQSRFPLLPVRLLLLDHFPSDKYLRNYRGKLGIVVDGKDTVVPEKFGLRLYDSYRGPKKLWQCSDGGHCQITEPSKFWNEAVGFWQGDAHR